MVYHSPLVKWYDVCVCVCVCVCARVLACVVCVRARVLCVRVHGCMCVPLHLFICDFLSIHVYNVCIYFHIFC